MMCLRAGPQASRSVSGPHYSMGMDDRVCMNYKEFIIAFWHPFGPHGRETTQDILKRKQKEIENNGWTLWSFPAPRPCYSGLLAARASRAPNASSARTAEGLLIQQMLAGANLSTAQTTDSLKEPQRIGS